LGQTSALIAFSTASFSMALLERGKVSTKTPTLDAELVILVLSFLVQLASSVHSSPSHTHTHTHTLSPTLALRSCFRSGLHETDEPASVWGLKLITNTHIHACVLVSVAYVRVSRVAAQFSPFLL